MKFYENVVIFTEEGKLLSPSTQPNKKRIYFLGILYKNVICIIQTTQFNYS